jgi:hypothetical protein
MPVTSISVTTAYPYPKDDHQYISIDIDPNDVINFEGCKSLISIDIDDLIIVLKCFGYTCTKDSDNG